MGAIRVGNRIKQHELKMPYHRLRAIPGSFIRNKIDAYYARHPSTLLPPTLALYHIRYYRRLTFICPETQLSPEKCMSFHTGDVFGAAGPQIDNQYFLLDSVVLPTIQGKIYVFLLAYPRLPCMVDAVLGQTVYRTSRDPVLMHITSMLPNMFISCLMSL